jgi:hypothetical protein
VDTISAIDSSVRSIESTSNGNPKLGAPKPAKNGLFQFFIGLGAFLLFGLLRFVYSKHLEALLSVLTKSTLGRMISKDSLWHDRFPRWFFVLIYYATAGFVAGHILQKIIVSQATQLTFWMWGISIILGIALLKFLMIQSVVLVFRFSKTARTFFNHFSVVNQLVGFVLLPLCGAMLLSPPILRNILLFVGALILAISLIFKLLINVAYVRNLSGVSFFHFILYLCAFEIIPLAVCARIVYNSLGA